jgi:hypothetical protein
MKSFFLAAAKLATGLFLAGLALAITISLYSWVTDSYKNSQAKQYETIKEWSADLSTNLGLQLQAKTKVLSGKLLLSVDVVGYPAYLPILAWLNETKKHNSSSTSLTKMASESSANQSSFPSLVAS